MDADSRPPGNLGQTLSPCWPPCRLTTRTTPSRSPSNCATKAPMPSIVSAALTQSRLRAAARPKFGDFASGMVFSQEGLEQATRLTVAAHHAQRYRAAGVRAVADLTCGLGADAMAFASLGLGVLAFEIDEATALLADYNLRHWADARVVHADAMHTIERGDIDADAVFADPARRNARGRRHDPRDYSPPLARRGVAARRAGPMSASRWAPPSATTTCRPRRRPSGSASTATWSKRDCGWETSRATTTIPRSCCAGTTPRARRLSPCPARPGAFGDYVLEPDGAVIRAGLVGPLADTLGARLIDPHIAYLTADAPIASPFATTFRILDALPYSEKRLASALAARGVGTAEIKKRGVDVDPVGTSTQTQAQGPGQRDRHSHPHRRSPHGLHR